MLPCGAERRPWIAEARAFESQVDVKEIVFSLICRSAFRWTP